MSNDIEARREALQRELWESGFNIGPPTAEHQEWRNNRMAAIRAELDALPKPAPRATGAEAGSLVIAHTLGAVYPSRPRPLEARSNHHSVSQNGPSPWEAAE